MKANIHIHIGPGHHEKTVLDQFKRYFDSVSHSNYYPYYLFESNNRIQSSFRYDSFLKLAWFILNKLNIRKNRIIDFTYPLYDSETSKRIDNVDLLYCWPQVSKKTIEKVREQGGKTLLDYPIPHITTWQNVLLEEKDKTGIIPHSLFSKKMVDRMLNEIDSADFITTPSQFVRESFSENGVVSDRLLLNRYGIEIELFDKIKLKGKNSSKLKVIFVGSVELRKGVHYLLRAFRELDPNVFELKIIGTVTNDMMIWMEKNYSPLSNISFLGQMEKSKVLVEIIGADVMVMPSLLEGLSLTILESMAAGTPVISSTNAGGLGLIEDSEDGFIIPIRDVNSIIEKLTWCAGNQDRLIKMGYKANQKVTESNNAVEYGNRLLESVRSILTVK